MLSVKTSPRPRWATSLSWWTVTVLIQGTIVWLTFADLRGPYFWLETMDAFKAVTFVLAMGSVLARTRLPWLFLAVNAGIYFVVTVALPMPLPLAEFMFAFVCSMYAFASQVPMRTAVIVGAGLEVVLVGAAIAVKGVTLFHVYTVATTAAIAVSVTVGQLAFSRRRLTETANRRAHEAERTREALAAVSVAEHKLAMARDLHDLVGHRVTVINLHAASASRALPDDPIGAQSSLAAIEASAQEIFSDVRDLLRDLRSNPPRAHDEQGVDGLTTLVHELEAGGLRVEVDIDQSLPLLPAAIDYAVYRILHEGLVNAYKHGSHESPTQVRVRWNGSDVHLHISNPVDRARSSGDATGYGVLGMRERAEGCGGHLRTQVRENQFELDVRIPVDIA